MAKLNILLKRSAQNFLYVVVALAAVSTVASALQEAPPMLQEAPPMLVVGTVCK